MNPLKIHSFSATGNTKLIGETLSREFEKHDRERPESIVGIGFPCYAFTYPREPVGKLLIELEKENKKRPLKAFIYATCCLSPGTSLDEVHRELDRAGIPVVGKFSFRCPSPGFIALSTGRERGIKGVFLRHVCNFERNLDRSIKKAAATLAKRDKKRFHPLICQIKILLNTPRRRFAHWNEHRLFRDYTIDNEKCQLCFRCVKNCPADNIAYINGEVRFINRNDCLKCMACMSHCPQDCITLGPSTVGMRRYDKNAENWQGTDLGLQQDSF